MLSNFEYVVPMFGSMMWFNLKLGLWVIWHISNLHPLIIWVAPTIVLSLGHKHKILSRSGLMKLFERVNVDSEQAINIVFVWFELERCCYPSSEWGDKQLGCWQGDNNDKIQAWTPDTSPIVAMIRGDLLVRSPYVASQDIVSKGGDTRRQDHHYYRKP